MSTRIKLCIGLILAVIIWQLTQIDSISNAMLALFLGGEVPVSHAIVPPSFVIGVSAVIVFFVVLALLNWLQPKAIRAAYSAKNQPQSVPIHSMTPPVTGLVYPKVKRPHLSRRLWLQHNYVVLAEAMRQNYVRFRVFAKYHIWRMRRTSAIYTQGVTKWSIGIAIPIAQTMARLAIRLWQWASPHLWKFDGWLERHTKAAMEKMLDMIAGNANSHF